MAAPRKNFEHGMLVSQGVLDGQTYVHKFGATPQMSINQTGSLWDVNDTLYPWTALDTPAVVNVERNNASDNGLVVTVQGLDSNWNVQEEEITITGADQTGTKLFRRVNRAFVTSSSPTSSDSASPNTVSIVRENELMVKVTGKLSDIPNGVDALSFTVYVPGDAC